MARLTARISALEAKKRRKKRENIAVEFIAYDQHGELIGTNRFEFDGVWPWSPEDSIEITFDIPRADGEQIEARERWLKCS